MAQPGPRNAITDVPGLKVGHCHDAELCSGVTVLLPDAPMCCAADIRGGGPGTREVTAMNEAGVVEQVHALVLSGGSAFGLDAATGVQSYLREKGIGFEIGSTRVPIVPQAILFDLLNGGNKNWGRHSPYRDMAYEAAANAAIDFPMGTVGTGYGATVAWKQSGSLLRAGLGSASLVTDAGITIGALVAVNAVGTVTIGDTPHFWAAPLEIGTEFGGCALPSTMQADVHAPILKVATPENTTLAIVATNAALTKMEAKRLAIMAQTGMARAIYPVHTPLDGDIVFAVSTGVRPLTNPVVDLAVLGALAANTLARAIARGVYMARSEPGPCEFPTYQDIFSKV